MSVRSGLLASFLVFVMALVGLGAWSAWHLRELGSVSRRIIADNYDSVVAAQDMKESLERQDSATLFILLGEVERGRAQLKEHSARFDRSFSRAANNITEPGEREAIAGIDALRTDYYARIDAVIGTMPAAMPAALSAVMSAARTDATSRAYFAGLEPLFNRLRGRVDDLLRVNQEAMRAKSRAAEQVARRWFATTLVLASGLVVASLLLATLLARRMVTTFASIELAVEAMKLGATDFMRKPMTPDTLRAAVDGALLKARGEQPPAEPAGMPASASAPASSTRRATDAAAIEASRPLDDDSAFWIRQAALALGQYVWNHAEGPADERLLVTRMSHDLANAARQKR